MEGAGKQFCGEVQAIVKYNDDMGVDGTVLGIKAGVTCTFRPPGHHAASLLGVVQPPG